MKGNEPGSPDPVDGGYGGYFGSGKSPASLTEVLEQLKL